MSSKVFSLLKKDSTLQKVLSNFWGVLSLSVILVFIIISLFAYLIAPDSSNNANTMHLSIHSKSPGFSVDHVVVEKHQNSRLF